MNDLVEFTNAYLEWLKEMKRNKRSLDIFNIETGDKPFNVVTGYKAKSIASLKSDYDLVTDRLNSSVKKCHSKEDKNKFLEMFFSGMSKLVNEKFNV